MVRVSGQTYRVVKRDQGEYEIFRLLDDALVGTFNSGRGLPVRAEKGIEPNLVKTIAMAILKVGKITWRGSAALPVGPTILPER